MNAYVDIGWRNVLEKLFTKISQDVKSVASVVETNDALNPYIFVVFKKQYITDSLFICSNFASLSLFLLAVGLTNASGTIRYMCETLNLHIDLKLLFYIFKIIPNRAMSMG